jgi:alpha-galactosidase
MRWLGLTSCPNPFPIGRIFTPLLLLGCSCGLRTPLTVPVSTSGSDGRSSLDGGLAPAPPMGWNSWNWFGKQAINEQIVRDVIDAMVAQGLRDAGYTYVVVDGGWRDTKLGPNGELLPHPVKFPGGVKRLADQAHANGLKFGLHTVPGTADCGGDPVGGFGHEDVQLQQFVEWGLDFVKLDKCNYAPGWTEDLVQTVYTQWRDRLAGCGRDITFSISAYVYRDWYPTVCNMARTTGDIAAKTNGGAVFDGVDGAVMAVAEINNQSAAYAGNSYWNDPDMMVTGNQGLTQEEQKAHFALWCVMSSPLMLGNDPRAMTQDEKDIVLNREAIAINQDPTEQGRRIKTDGDVEIWAKKLRGNRRALLLLNRNATAAKAVTVAWPDVGLAGKVQVKDVFGGTEVGVLESALTKETPPHAGWFLLLSSPSTP